MSRFQKFIAKALLLTLVFPLALHAFNIEGKDGWTFEVSKGFMKKHTSSNLKDKTAKDKFVKRWGTGHQNKKKSTIVRKSDFVNAVKKMDITEKKKFLWVNVVGKNVFTEAKGSKALHKCQEVKKIQIQQKLLNKQAKRIQLFHLNDIKASAARECKK